MGIYLNSGNETFERIVKSGEYVDKTALLVELKWDKTAQGAIDQIKNKHYTDTLKEYEGNMLLVGINYDKKEKKHECRIEKA